MNQHHARRTQHIALLGVFVFTAGLYAAETDGWPMRSHNVRRTGRGTINGPRAGKEAWRYVAEGGVLINMEPAATRDGVYFGTWGLTRKTGAEKTEWDKFDGKIYGLNPGSGKPLWPPLHPGRTPYSYKYDGRKPTQQDFPAGAGLHWNWSNGTVEGTPAVDPQDGTLYIGRGDGSLYAVDPKAGTVKWRHRTDDPARPDDPEGGGEVIGGPLVTAGGVIVFATFAAPVHPNPPKQLRHETNAVYAVNRAGKRLWRYPKEGTVECPFVAPVALSPDGARVYAVTGLAEAKFPGELVALELSSGKLLWRMDLGKAGGNDMAVGIDGIIYIAGSDIKALGSTPVAFAVVDKGAKGEFVWGPKELDGVRPPAHFAAGIALHEEGNRVRDVYVSTTLVRELNGLGGKLHRLDPKTGASTAAFDPEKAAPACVGGMSDITLDKDGVLYVAARGRWPIFKNPEVRGRMYCLRAKPDGFEVLWSFEVDGQLDWNSPALAPDGTLLFGSSARLNPFQFALAREPEEKVKDADPIFYGIRD